MVTGTSQTIQVIVSTAPTGLPAWLQNPAGRGFPAAIKEVIAIPNSTAIPIPQSSTTLGVQPGYLNDSTGTNFPQVVSAASNVLHQSTYPNKYGIVPSPLSPYNNIPYYAAHHTFQGSAHDSGVYSGRPANLLSGCGDSHWADNTVHRFVFGVDAPFWEVAIKGTSYLNWKTDMYGNPDGRDIGWALPVTGTTGQTFYEINTHHLYWWTGSAWLPFIYFTSNGSGGNFPAVGVNGAWSRDSFDMAGYKSNGTSWVRQGRLPTQEVDVITNANDDFRGSRYYDGSLRGGHAYASIWCWEQDNLYIRSGQRMGYPSDLGYGDDTGVGDLAAKQWIGYPQDTPSTHFLPVVSSIGVSEYPDFAPMSKHPITEDLWRVIDTSVCVLRRLGSRTGVWEKWRTEAFSISTFCVFSIAYNQVAGDYILGRTYTGGVLRFWWMKITGTDKTLKLFTTVTGSTLPTTLLVAYNYDGIIWCPDINKFLMLVDPRGSSQVGTVVSLEKINDTTIDVQPFTFTGLTFPAPGNGGVLNKWHYNRSNPKGIVYRYDDAQPTLFIRTV